MYKCTNKVIEQFVKEKDTLQLIMENIRKYCVKEEFYSRKDYILKNYQEPFFKSKKKREVEEARRKKKLQKHYKKVKYYVQL